MRMKGLCRARGRALENGLLSNVSSGRGSGAGPRGYDRADAERGRFPTGNVKMPGRAVMRLGASGQGEEKKQFTTEARSARRKLVQLE